MAKRTKYRWQDLKKSTRLGDSLNGPVRVVGHVEKVPRASHKSKSGPVRVIRTFTPEPLTPAQERARLQHKLALLEDRIAARQAFGKTKGWDSSTQLATLLKERNDTVEALSSFGE